MHLVRTAESIALAVHDPDAPVVVRVQPVVDRDLFIEADVAKRGDDPFGADGTRIAGVVQVAARLREYAPQTDADLREVFALPGAQLRQAAPIDDRAALEAEDDIAAGEGPGSEDASAFARSIPNDGVYRNMSLSCGRTYDRAVSLPSGIGSPRTIAAGRRSSFPITSSVAAAISSAIAISVTRIS